MATNKQPEDRWETVKQLWRDEKFVYQVLGGLMLVGIGVWIGSRLFDGDPGYATNLYTEVLSISVTVFVLDLLARRREDRREEVRLKHDLIMRMGSQVNDTAVSAANELDRRGWLWDGSLQGAHLSGADLQGAYMFEAFLKEALLVRANLQATNLSGSNLTKAYMVESDLRRADLSGATLQEADLLGANLQEADLSGADLRMADLDSANLSQAILSEAHLQGAKLYRANLQGALLFEPFDHRSILPDGSRWTPETDMRRFTDPTHHEFWRPRPGSVWWYRIEDAD